MYVANNSDVDIKNITVSDNTSYSASGIYFSNSNLNIENSIIWNNVSHNQSFTQLESNPIGEASSQSLSIDYSIISNNSWNLSNCPICSININYNIEHGTIIVNDPLFVGNGSYVLSTNSPGIDSGNPLLVNDDLFNTISDIGCYMFDHIFDCNDEFANKFALSW